MKRNLIVLMILPFFLLAGCSDSDSSNPKSGGDVDTFGSPELDGEFEDANIGSLEPQTGMKLSFGDYNFKEVEQILVFSYRANVTRIVTENRYYRVSGSFGRPVACDVYYYLHDTKTLRQIARENGLSVKDVLAGIGSGQGARLFGGRYSSSPWYFQATFVNNQASCSNSIYYSRLMETVREGYARITHRTASENAKSELNR